MNSAPGVFKMKSNYYIALVLWGLTLVFMVTAGTETFAADKRPALPWDNFNHDHPRLFFNKSILEDVRARIKRGEAHDFYQEHLEWAESLYSKEPDVGDHGQQAAILAFIYLINKDPRALAAAKKRLKLSVQFYKQMDRANEPVAWFSKSRIQAICTYDWLYEDLTPSERKQLIMDLLDHVENVQPLADGTTSIPGNNIWADHTAGFYGTQSLLWYVGIAALGDGFDDERARHFIEVGYDLNYKTLEFRRRMAGDDGGSTTGSLNYALGHNAYAEFNFFHTMRSAFATDLAPDWPHVAWIVNYLLWNRLPGNRWFGAGDAYHEDNVIPQHGLYSHLAHIRHFYGKSQPEYAALSAWLQQQLDQREYSYDWPFTAFLLDQLPESPPPLAPSDFKLPPARNFENMGQVFLRSGWGEGDTYALFTVGGMAAEHKHFDENSFTIYHQGFLALDTGTRPEPGSHLFSYYCRTVAHNCLVIKMRGEELPEHWGEFAPGEPTLPLPNDGGQNNELGGKLVAFEAHPEFTYVAGDATGAYHPDKCALALRQFVFVPPSYFVVFDRVVSKDPDQKKTFLLHTAQRPTVKDYFTFTHEDGRLTGLTLLPENPEIKVIGGPGHQFWSDGRNWPLPKGYKIPAWNPLFGQWRLEISPSDPGASTVFLHFLEAGDNKAKAERPQARLIKDDGRAGVEFERDDLRVRLTFELEGPPAGMIVYQKGSTRLEQALSTTIQPQSGIADNN